MLRLWIGGEFVVAGRGDTLGRLSPEMFANTTSNREGRGTGRATAGQHVARGWQQVVITSGWSSGHGFSGCCTPSRMCYIDVRLCGYSIAKSVSVSLKGSLRRCVFRVVDYIPEDVEMSKGQNLVDGM